MEMGDDFQAGKESLPHRNTLCIQLGNVVKKVRCFVMLIVYMQ